MTEEEKQTVLWYEKQKKLGATIAIKYYKENLQKGVKRNVKTAKQKTKQSAYDR